MKHTYLKLNDDKDQVHNISSGLDQGSADKSGPFIRPFGLFTFEETWKGFEEIMGIVIYG